MCRRAIKFLAAVYDPSQALFPFTTRLDHGTYRSVYDHPRVIRSTINCLVGLEEAARFSTLDGFTSSPESMVADFVARHRQRVVEPADLGLLLLLLAGNEVSPPLRQELVAAIGAIAGQSGARSRLTAQDLCWMLWGCCAAVGAGVAAGERPARQLFVQLTEHFAPRSSALATHDLRHGRFGIVSFGASAYFLRCLHEYADRFDDHDADRRFLAGVRALLGAQGPYGEWPWLLSKGDGRPLDVYPVFSVHQHSMSLLFLLPAFEKGLQEAGDAIRRSLAWVAGDNQLHRPMVHDEPFLVYRSLERKSRAPRPRRFARALLTVASGRRGGLAAPGKLRINTESRSYEMGWLLFALSDVQRIGRVSERW